MQENKRSKLGFTLIELSVVLLVVSLLMIAVVKGSDLINQAKISSARQKTANSPLMEIKGLVLWLETTLSDSFLVSEVADNQEISTWLDGSTTNVVSPNNATASVGSRPRYSAKSINALPVIRFDGLNDFMTLPTAQTLGMTNNDYEMFFVYQSRSTAIQFLIAGASEQYEVHLNGAASVRFIPTNGKYSDINISNLLSAHIVSARVVNSNGTVRVDGVDTSDVESLSRSTSTAALVIGKRTSNQYFLNGDIAEIIIFNRALSDQERGDIESYLSDKYDITISS